MERSRPANRQKKFANVDKIMVEAEDTIETYRGVKAPNQSERQNIRELCGALLYGTV
jgi:hypothetical protein